MASPFVKFWKYLMASFSSKIDEHADPKVQIQQAIEEAQRQHQALSQQAAAVIGNQRQLEMKLNRQLGDVEKLQASARQALVLADEARSKGDEQKAQQFENAAQGFATQLVTAEQGIEDLKTLHDQSLQAAAQAKQAVERNSMMLQQKLAERTKLLSQLEQAKMQEQVSASLTQMSELAAPGNVPSLEEVRDKIEKRYATAIGSAELAQNSVQGRMLEVQASTTQLAGSSRLEQIRASMHGGQANTPPQVTAGNSAAAQLQAVERARNTAPPLERAPLVEGVRVLRIQLADGVDRYCSLVAAAGQALAASTAFQDPRAVLDDATDHMAGLASAMRDVSGYSAY